LSPPLTKKDFETDQEVRWCPGCGDYAILSSVQKVMPTLGIPREQFVFISGIGCSSRFPYYMNTFGFHTIHGRAPAIATGLKHTRPDLSVWMITGDGDALSIGGNHLIHLLRRNVDIKVLLFNNRIYGLTKGQYSPTSELGKKAKSTPFGSIDHPFDPLQLALGAGATFVARSVDVEPKHLQEILQRAAAHKGAAFVEILQNCNVFNDGAWDHITAKEAKEPMQLRLEHGKPAVFAGGKKAVRLNGLELEVVDMAEGVTPLVWDEKANAALPFLMSQLHAPVPMGVLRAVSRPVYHELEQAQETALRSKAGDGDLDKLLRSGDVWTVG
jgi:2-oxoglutarate ferredoxin oxidoreductase subunit beta